MQNDQQANSYSADHDGEKRALSAEQQDAEGTSCKIKEGCSGSGATIKAEPEGPGIRDGYQDQRCHDRAEPMQKRTEPQAQGNEGRVLPMRHPLEEAPDGEEPDEGGTNPGSEVSRSQSSRHLLRVSLGAVADVRNQAQGKLRNNARGYSSAECHH